MKKAFLLLAPLLFVACASEKEIKATRKPLKAEPHQQDQNEGQNQDKKQDSNPNPSSNPNSNPNPSSNICPSSQGKDPHSSGCTPTEATAKTPTDDHGNKAPDDSHETNTDMEEDFLLRWSHHELSIDYNWDTCPTDLRDTLRQAFQEAVNIWSSISGSKLKISLRNALNVAPEEVYGENNKRKVTIIPLATPHVAVVVCDNDFHQSNASRPKVQGTRLASTFYRSSGTYLRHAAIVLNTDGEDSIRNAERFGGSILSTLTHELGHMIGLQEHDPYWKSIMYARASMTADLSIRDKRRIVARYPASAPASTSTSSTTSPSPSPVQITQN